MASCRIWDALGFKRVGRIKGCGNLASSPDVYVDAIIYGRELGPESEDYVSEERFDKIRYYLKHARYPNGADRAEKSRLRSAATHYKLLPPEKGREAEEDAERLMLRDKEVISDPQRQYEIGRRVHVEGQHGGINKTTATIAEKYHWVRIKETVSLVIKNCENCKDNSTKAPPPVSKSRPEARPRPLLPSPVDMMDRVLHFDQQPATTNNGNTNGGHGHLQSQQSVTSLVDAAIAANPETQNHRGVASAAGVTVTSPAPTEHATALGGPAPVTHMGFGELSQYTGIPLDPQIMHQSSQMQQQQHQQRQRGSSRQVNQAYQQLQPHIPPSAGGYGQHQSSSTSTSHHGGFSGTGAGDLQTQHPLFQQQPSQQRQGGPHALTHANPHKTPDVAGTGTGSTARNRDTLDQGATTRNTRSKATRSQTAAHASTTAAAAAAMAAAANNAQSNQDAEADEDEDDDDDEDANFDVDADMDVDVNIDADVDMTDSGQQGDDTRLTSDRHVTVGDPPMGSG